MPGWRPAWTSKRHTSRPTSSSTAASCRRATTSSSQHLGGVLRAVLRATFALTTTPSRSRRRALPLHRAILDGIAAGDEDAAETAAQTLIADTAADIRRSRSATTALAADARPDASFEVVRPEPGRHDDAKASVRRVGRGPRRDGVPLEPVPMVRHEDGCADAEGELDRLRSVHVPDDAARLALRVAPVDRQQRDVDPERVKASVSASVTIVSPEW